MASKDSFAGHRTHVLNGLYARLSARQKATSGFVWQPEPRTIGNFARGRQLVAGNLLFSGYQIEQPNPDLWGVISPDGQFDSERHGFGWLDDLAAVGDAKARARAQRWLQDWIRLYGRGRGPGWTPDLTGRRLIRWINHALFLLRGGERAANDAFFRTLAAQTWFLSKRWKSAAPGLPLFEALVGMVYAGLALDGLDGLAEPAIKGLARECDTQIGDRGGLPTRNPEELLEVLMLLTWAGTALSAAGRAIPKAQTAAIARIAPSLRTLRHADGGLARFHGGGKGVEGRLDYALAESHITRRHADGLAMGFARLSSGRTTVIVDAAPPPEPKASENAHASTLAFEVTSGRRPLIVSCGSGATFGLEWRRAGRATPSHSVLCLDGYSSARLVPSPVDPVLERLVDGPSDVPIERARVPDGQRFQGGHDGYAEGHGLTVVRSLDLTSDGRTLSGEDMLIAVEDAAKRRFDSTLDATRLQGLAFDIRFHLHPEVDATLDLDNAAVSMALKSGEIWVFRHDGQRRLALDPSVYLEKGRLKPRATKQIVLSGRAIEYATRVRWTLSKAEDTALAIRDVAPTDTIYDD